MENRRQYYRQPLPRHEIQVQFQSADGTSSFAGEIVNLSIGGMRVKAPKTESTPGKKWHASFTLDDEGPSLRIPVERVYAENDVPGYFGFAFLMRPKIRDQEAQERIIWSFLLEEQRTERRRAREARRKTG
jgi:c-di-GMP-binding flagellar brake protein YcgR